MDAMPADLVAGTFAAGLPEQWEAWRLPGIRQPRQDIREARMLLLDRRLDEALAVLERAERALGLGGSHGNFAMSPVNSVLSERERHVLNLVSLGLSNKRIALLLAIAPETVKAHVKRIFVKLEVGTRAHAVLRATSLGLLSGSGEQ
jgi:DNA-binding CsgD family transcriptional regulator